MSSIMYRKYKDLGLCPRCGKIETGGIACVPCKERHRKKQEEWLLNMSWEQYNAHREADSFNSRYRYKQFKEAGICTQCAKTKVKPPYVNCAACRKKRNAKAKTKYKKRCT